MVKSSDLAVAPHPFQFYIRDMLVWTTALAVFLSVWKCLPHWSAYTGALTAIFASFTCVAVASMFFSLGGGWIVARILSLPLAIGVGAALLAATDAGGSMWLNGFLLGFMAIWFVASLLIIRIAGYRLAWRPELVRDDVVESQDATNTQESPGPPCRRPLN